MKQSGKTSTGKILAVLLVVGVVVYFAYTQGLMDFWPGSAAAMEGYWVDTEGGEHTLSLWPGGTGDMASVHVDSYVKVDYQGEVMSWSVTGSVGVSFYDDAGRKHDCGLKQYFTPPASVPSSGVKVKIGSMDWSASAIDACIASKLSVDSADINIMFWFGDEFSVTMSFASGETLTKMPDWSLGRPTVTFGAIWYRNAAITVVRVEIGDPVPI